MRDSAEKCLFLAEPQCHRRGWEWAAIRSAEEEPGLSWGCGLCVTKARRKGMVSPGLGPGAWLFPWRWVSLCRVLSLCYFGCNVRAPGWKNGGRSVSWSDARVQKWLLGTPGKSGLLGWEGRWISLPGICVGWEQTWCFSCGKPSPERYWKRYWRWLCNRLCLLNSCPVKELICVKDSAFFPHGFFSWLKFKFRDLLSLDLVSLPLSFALLKSVVFLSFLMSQFSLFPEGLPEAGIPAGTLRHSWRRWLLLGLTLPL